MPRIKATMLDAEFQMLKQASDAHNESNDCAVVAIAAVTGAPYATVLKMLTAAGRKPRKGTFTFMTRAVIEQLGFVMEEVPMSSFIERYPKAHQVLRCVTTHHPDRFRKIWADGCNYLFRTPRHILAVMNGRNVDWSRGKALRVRCVYRVYKKV